MLINHAVTSVKMPPAQTHDSKTVKLSTDVEIFVWVTNSQISCFHAG